MTEPRYWRRATTELSRRDGVMRGLIERYGPEGLTGRNDAFGTLARAIVGQQISVQAADKVWRRLETFLGEVTAVRVAASSSAGMLKCGLSRQKVEYLMTLAGNFVDGTLGPDRWVGLDDEAAIADLVRLRGIGRWTAEMFLIFHLLRPDVLPLGDLGLRKAIDRHYGDGEALSEARLGRIAESWKPWRSVATWYLWRSLDPEPVVY